MAKQQFIQKIQTFLQKYIQAFKKNQKKKSIWSDHYKFKCLIKAIEVM